MHFLTDVQPEDQNGFWYHAQGHMETNRSHGSNHKLFTYLTTALLPEQAAFITILSPICRRRFQLSFGIIQSAKMEA